MTVLRSGPNDLTCGLGMGKDWSAVASLHTEHGSRVVISGRAVVLAARLPVRTLHVEPVDIRTSHGRLTLADDLRQDAWMLSERLTALAAVYVPVRALLVTPPFARINPGKASVGYSVCRPSDVRRWLRTLPRDVPGHAVEQMRGLIRSAAASNEGAAAVRQSTVRSDTF